MKYDDRKAFPYPILSDNREHSDDYVRSDFQASIELTPADKSGIIILNANFDISEPEILNRIGKDANYAIYVFCVSTNLRKLIRSTDKKIEYSFEKGELYSKVTMMACVVCTSNINKYYSVNFHKEFNNKHFNLLQGSLLAIAAPEIFFIDADPSKPLGTVFDLKADKNIKQGEFQFDIEDEKIQILMHEIDFKRFNDARLDSSIRPFLVMSVYFPVLVEILHIMASDEKEMHETKKWYRAIFSKLEEQGIKLTSDKAYIYAQQLLQLPLSKLPLSEES